MTVGRALRRGVPRRTATSVAVRAGRAALCGVLLTANGCYTYAGVQPSGDLTGQRISFRITDEGRLTVRDRLGPGVAKVDGRVVAQDASGWTLKVFGLTTADGSRSTWTGETVQLARTAVDQTVARRLDRGRSLLAVGLVVGGAVAFALSRDLFGGGLGPTDPSAPPPSESR